MVADPTPSANRGGKPSPSTGAAGPGGTDGWLTPRSEPKPGSLAERFWKVNIGDWHLLRGVPYVMRVASGLLKPNRRTPGLMAGQVEAVGGAVRQFRPGDEVFGWCKGAFAEYASVAEDSLLPKPANLTIEQSAAVGDSAFTALAAVRDQGKVQPGHRVLINGASGGVGTFAVQIARSFGADVTGVCGTRNLANG